MATGRGSIETSSRVSCIRLTTDATPTTKPIPSFGSRRTVPGIRAEILRRRPRRKARAVVGRPLALPDAPSAVVHSLAADRCAALSQASCSGAADRRRPGQAESEPGYESGPVRPLGLPLFAKIFRLHRLRLQQDRSRAAGCKAKGFAADNYTTADMVRNGLCRNRRQLDETLDSRR